MTSGAEIPAKLRQKYAFLWKTREEMTASERRWKWVKKDALPADLQKIMDMLMGGKKKKGEDGDDDDDKKRPNEQKDKDQDIEDAMTKIKRDYLSIDFTQYPNVSEIVDALKEERMKTKYSAVYHAQVLQKIFDEMPCVQEHEIKMKIEVIIYLVNTLFQTARTSFLPREQWITVHDRVRELIKLCKSTEFIKTLTEAHAPTPEKPPV